MFDPWPGTVSHELRAIVERVCTQAEIDVLKRKAAGRGRRSIALELGISDSSVRDRMRNAERKVRAEVAAMRGISPV